jgi:hypothetical protein
MCHVSILRSNWFTVILTQSHFWTQARIYTQYEINYSIYTQMWHTWLSYFTFNSNSKLWSQPPIIQDTFLGIPVTGYVIQHPVTYVYFSQFIANKTHSMISTIMLQGSDSTQPVTVYSNNRHSGLELYWHCIIGNDNGAKGNTIWHKTESNIFTPIMTSYLFCSCVHKRHVSRSISVY